MIGKYPGVRGSPPEPVTALSPVQWYRYQTGLGTTTFATSTQVSSWADQSGNNRHWLQASTFMQPLLQSDNSVVFNGVSTCLSTSPFTFDQPATVYLLARQMNWSNNGRLVSGISTTAVVLQAVASPRLGLNAGSSLNSISSLPVSTYGVICAVFNGTSSLLRINASTLSGDAGLNGSGGFAIGAAVGGSNPSAMEAKEFIAFNAAHSTTTQTAVMVYLGTVGGLNSSF